MRTSSTHLFLFLFVASAQLSVSCPATSSGCKDLCGGKNYQWNSVTLNGQQCQSCVCSSGSSCNACPDQPNPAPRPQRPSSSLSAGSPISVNAYDSSDCSGSPVLSKSFDGSCQSITVSGTTYYGRGSCSNGDPSMCLSGDSTCSACQKVSVVGNGRCGNGFALFNSMKGDCVDSGAGVMTTDSSGIVLVLGASLLFSWL